MLGESMKTYDTRTRARWHCKFSTLAKETMTSCVQHGRLLYIVATCSCVYRKWERENAKLNNSSIPPVSLPRLPAGGRGRRCLFHWFPYTPGQRPKYISIYNKLEVYWLFTRAMLLHGRVMAAYRVCLSVCPSGVTLTDCNHISYAT